MYPGDRVSVPPGQLYADGGQGSGRHAEVAVGGNSASQACNSEDQSCTSVPQLVLSLE